MGAAPGINGLIRIADDEQVAVSAGKQAGQLKLSGAHILELVHHHILHAILPLGAHLGEALQNIGREIDQVVEVAAEAFFLLVEIAQKNLLVAARGVGEPSLDPLVVQQQNVFNVR